MFFKSTGNEKVDQALRLLMQASSDKHMCLSECLGELCLIIKEHVHEKPWSYIAIAAFSGLAAGLLLS